jgi:hypothetical protein
LVTGAAVPKGVVAAAVTAVLWTSCATAQKAGGANADCYRIEDCQEGLVCIEKKCSRNLAKIMGESPPMAGGGQGGAPAQRDGSPDAPGNTRDGAPSGGAPPANGGAPPANGGAPPANGGSAPRDAGSD